MDRVEDSNLSRSVLFRESDNGRPKSEAAAESVRGIYPLAKVQPFVGDVVHDLGMGVYRWADVVLGGLDNREARLSINRSCYRLNRPWIDGAIESIQGVARVFVPDSPCYECTMTEGDWNLVQKRRSCNLLSREEMETGKTPTTPTISSIIAGVQCQEAVKLLHGLEVNAGCGWVFQGLTADSYPVRYQMKEDCFSHDPLDEIIPLEVGSEEMPVGRLLEMARKELGEKAVIEISRDMIEKLICPKCHREEYFHTSLGKVPLGSAWCPHCPDTMREVVSFYVIDRGKPFLDKTFAQIGLPAYDIVMARTRDRCVGYEFSADGRQVLGPLYDDHGFEESEGTK